MFVLHPELAAGCAYFQALQHLFGAAALLLVGSNSPHQVRAPAP
jgi:hypothetical protein